ncbi:MerR family transcriptional regulator [Glutamicibacter sp. TV12E]|uniref:MerR family transcriptional regulator n=1 Tax=Glutamicibacter sp. TV12E TaxID=3446362 RepID=UPI00403321A8
MTRQQSLRQPPLHEGNPPVSGSSFPVPETAVPNSVELSIGEMVSRTGISERLLRYYEDKGLLHPERTTRGHRLYISSDIPRANLIRFLIRGGFQTNQIRFLFDCIAQHINVRDLCGELLGDLQNEVNRIDSEIRDLMSTRDYIASLLSGPESN